MSRLSIPHVFRAEGATIPWFSIDRLHREAVGTLPPAVDKQRRRDLQDRSVEVHLRWSCWERVGVPFEPFNVWVRTPRDELEEIAPDVEPEEGQLRLDLPFEAGVVEIRCDVIDPGEPVAAFGRRGTGGLRSAVCATAANHPSGGTANLVLRGSGMTNVLLVNGRNPELRADPIRRIIDDPNWIHIERVGLPVDGSWGDTSYDHSEQGLLSSPTSPVDAAVERVGRGRPPMGWWPFTEDGAVAPPWEPVDPGLMVSEVLRDLLPNVEPLFKTGSTSTDQIGVVDRRRVDPPQQGSRQSTAETTASLPPLGMLLLAGGSEPGLSLATGFGTSYGVEPATIPEIQFGETDFLVTAHYEDLPFVGDIELAAFVPWPGEHLISASPSGIRAERDGLVEPALVDLAWRESVKISWQRVETTAALGRPSGTAAARYDAMTLPDSESMLPKRDAGGWRSLLPMPDGPEGEPGHDRTAIVDLPAEIPLDSGGRSARYAVAAQDVFGVWSRWSDVAYSGPEPDPPTPRVISAQLNSSYDGSTSCPADFEIELALDWSMRTPVEITLSLGFFPMDAADDEPPPGLGPEGATPTGTFRSSVSIPFSGDAPTPGPGIGVTCLDSAGENVIAPGPLQGNSGRRYRISASVPLLDFSSTPRWGMRVWARSSLLVIAGPAPWAPLSPALIAVAASPVPVTPIPAPPPPGVPLGSTPDAEGRSHVKVSWSLSSGANPSSISVWELSETALRQRTGIGPAAEGTSPGVRLQQMRAAYDALPAENRRSLFRRTAEVEGSVREKDVALPKGSKDIHLFGITTLSQTGAESNWPTGTAEAALQAAIAPRVVRPATPTVRTILGTAGSVTIDLSAPSRIPVQAFHLYRSQSAAASRSPNSMGPPFAVIPADPPSTGTDPDPETGELTYTASWAGPFAESWDDWFVRAVAIPVGEAPVEGIRGQRSESNEPIVLTVRPSGPPDLDPLTFEFWGPDEDGVVVRSATNAPLEATPLGPHRLRVEVEGSPATAFASLIDVAEDDAEPPAGSAPGPVVVRGPTSEGRTPLALWFVRPDRTEPTETAFRLADPIGRVEQESITVPGWRPPPDITLDILDVFTIVGRGIAAQLRSDAPIDGDPSGVIHIRATGVSHRRLLPMRRRLEASFQLEDIPLHRGPFHRFEPVQVMRTSKRSPYRYSAFVALQPPLTLVVLIELEDGRRVEATRIVRSGGS